MASKSLVFRFGDVEVQEREFSILKAGETLPVEPKAFRVLLILLQNPQKLISKEELLNAVWGDVAVGDNSLARSVALLRRLLGDDTHNPRYIETVATVGYRLVCTVESVGDPTGVATAPDPATAARSGETANAESTLTHRPEGVTRKARGRKWMLAVGTGALALLTMGVWYLRRPLPPPRITAYTQITHDGRYKSLGATDGSRLYFTQFSPNLIAQVGVNGGEVAQLPIAVPGVLIFLSDISPDGSTTLIGAYEVGHLSGGSQWVVPILGGAAKRLEDGFGGAFSPDGSSIIYSTINGDIFVVRTDGTGKSKLASVGSVADGFRWSPDGKVIRFRRDSLLWEMSSDGTGIHRLLPDWKVRGPQCCGRWTQDGRFYVFLATVQRGGQMLALDELRGLPPLGGQIWALDERRGLFRRPSSVPIQLTSEPIRWLRPIPGRDEKAIFVDGVTLRGELSRIDLKTGSPQPFLGGISAEYVSFSPDGNYVAYVAFPEGTLWKANRDGGNRMQLTQPPDQVINPRWSPDSKEIVFMAESPDGHFSIQRISAAEGTPLWLMSEESANMNDASWSSDGKKVLYGMGLPHLEKNDLRIVDLDTQQVTILSGSDGMWSPRWSPDGRYVLALQPVSHGLSLFDFTTQQWHTLPVSFSSYPSFSHDGRFIYFLRYGREQGVFRIPLAGGKEERVVDMSDWHLTGHWGYSMTLDPTDAPLVLRGVGSNDIYALTLEEK